MANPQQPFSYPNNVYSAGNPAMLAAQARYAQLKQTQLQLSPHKDGGYDPRMMPPPPPQQPRRSPSTRPGTSQSQHRFTGMQPFDQSHASISSAQLQQQLQSHPQQGHLQQSQESRMAHMHALQAQQQLQALQAQQQLQVSHGPLQLPPQSQTHTLAPPHSPGQRKRKLTPTAHVPSAAPGVGGIGGTQNINPNVQRMSMGPDVFAEAHAQSGAGTGVGLASVPSVVSPGPHGSSRRFTHTQGTPSTPGTHPHSSSQTHLGSHTQSQQLQTSSALPSTQSSANVPASASTSAFASGSAATSASGSTSASASAGPVAAALNPATTRITMLSLAGSGRTIPPLSLREQRALRGWMDADRGYEGAWRGMRERMAREAVEANRSKLGWWEEPVSAKGRERFGLLWPDRKRAERVRKLKKAGVRWEGLRIPSKLRRVAEAKKEDLVPVRLEIDVEHHKLRETFVWNVNDPLITPEIFAQSLVDDFRLASHHGSTIAKAVHEQLMEHEGSAEDAGEGETSPVVCDGGGTGDEGRDCGVLDEAGEVWWRCWRKRIRTEDGYVKLGGEESERDTVVDEEGDADDEAAAKVKTKRRRRKGRGRKFGVMVPEIMGDVPMEVDEIAVDSSGVDEEMRILIKLDILVGSMKLEDQFEWDVGCVSNSPEQFAILYTTELGLPGEFTTAIAHQIREQIHGYRKTLSLLGAGGPVTDDDDLRPAFLPPVTRASVARTVDTASAHMPLLNYMSDGEIERTERERDKELKRKRRTARGRALGPRLVPDRTHRTPGIGFPELDSAALQAAQAASVPTTSRRAAAAAASLTIANMVASENGGLPVQLGMPEAGRPPIGAAKEAVAAAAAAKKAAASSASARVPPRLFKAPPFPPAVLRARAKTVAPTPSTGLDPGKYRGVVPKEAAEATKEEAQPVVAQPAVPAKLTAKQLRDLEKEAKEKEYAEGQHENMIDGVWHCSNCGCPETIAVGRRKGPLGDKSQCGPCGKFYHRHRRPRPVEYHPEESYHVSLKVETDRAKAVNRRRGGAAALRAMNQEAASAADSSTSVVNVKSSAAVEQDEPDEDEDKPEVKDDKPGSLNAVDIVGAPVESAAGAASPADTSSSEEPPLALSKGVVARGNGSVVSRSAPNSSQSQQPPSTTIRAPLATTLSPAMPEQHAQEQSPQIQPQAQAPQPQSPHLVSPSLASAEAVAPPSSSTSTRPMPSSKSGGRIQAPRPEWLKNALDAMQSRYPEDRFDVVLRKNTEPSTPAEWRVKCLDCPGKLYTPGPEETLANFEVHLKNRLHRAKVNARVQGMTPPP